MGSFASVPDASAGQISRPHRDTSSRSHTSTGRVLLAVPQDGHGYNYLHTATRGYHGRAVRCGVGYGEPSRLVIGHLPTRYRYNAAYDLCERRTVQPGLQTFRPGDATANRSSGSLRTAGPVVASGQMTIIAAGPTRFEDLDASMQNDPWALMDAGRYRDAKKVFEQQMASDNSAQMQAGHAVATALSGDLDGGADALASLAGNADALRSAGVSASMSAKLTGLADTLYADQPNAQRVLRALANADQPGDA